MSWAKHDRRAYNADTSHRESKLEKENERLRQENAELRRRLVVDAVWDDLRAQRPSRVAVTVREEDELLDSGDNTERHELLVDLFTEDYIDGAGDA